MLWLVLLTSPPSVNTGVRRWAEEPEQWTGNSCFIFLLSSSLALIGKIQKAISCGRPPNLQALSFYYVLVKGVGFKRQETQNTTLKTYGKLPLFIFVTLYHWDQKVQNSVFYEAFLLITWIKPSAGVTKYSKCMGSHVARDLTMPRTIGMVHLWFNKLVN